MATTSRLNASNGYYGHSGNKSYTTSSPNHLYVGKSSGTSDYRSRLTFPAMSSLAEVGADRIRITKLLLHIRRNEGGSATTITAGCSASSAWGAPLDAQASGEIAGSTGGYQTVDLTALADAVTEYNAKWYLHISGTTPRTRFDSTGAGRKQPYIEVTWERAAATICGDRDSAVLGADTVTFTITPEVEGETHTLTYSLGDAQGTIAERAGNTIPWTPPLDLASEIPNADSAAAEIGMTVYDAAGNVQRTEVYYQTVSVPESIHPVIADVGATMANALSGYPLAGRSSLKLSPVIDMTGSYGAGIETLTAAISGGQEIAWTTLNETAPGVFTAPEAQTGVLPEGVVTLTVTVTDSRGREATRSVSYIVKAYSPPVITEFKVYRYGAIYNENEEIIGYGPSDVGEYVAVNLLAEACSVAPYGTQLNLLQYSIVGTNAETGATITGRAISGAFLDENNVSADSGRRIQIIFNSDIFPGAVSTDEAWNYTATVTDTAGGTAIQYSTVAPGHAALSISPDKHGAAIGMIATGTKAKPKFEVAKGYESHFYGPAYDKNGAEILGGGGAKMIASGEKNYFSVPSGSSLVLPLAKVEEAGLYLIRFQGIWASNVSGYRDFTLTNNYSTIACATDRVFAAGSTSSIIQNVVALAELEANDEIGVNVSQTSDSALNLYQPQYKIARIGG